MPQKKVQDLLDSLGEALKEERDLIHKKIKAHKAIADGFNLRSQSGKGKYKAFHWIQLTKKDTGEIYTISMLSNDIDPDSGNTHTLLGRIQFAKCERKMNGRIGTNRYDEKVGKWYFCSENLYNPKIEIGSDGYQDLIINEFIKYSLN